MLAKQACSFSDSMRDFLVEVRKFVDALMDEVMNCCGV